MTREAALRRRFDALCRLLLDSGEITPTGVVQIGRVLDDEAIVEGQPPRVDGAAHALLCGMVMGALVNAGLDVEPEFLPGLVDRRWDYAASLVLTLPQVSADPSPTIRARLVVEIAPEPAEVAR